jgi:outer membrane protein, heavy metal efflux system
VDDNPRLNQKVVKREICPGRTIGSVATWRWCLLPAVLVGAFGDRAAAQGPTVDTSVPALPGAAGSLLGPAPGSGSSLLGPTPGAGGGSFNNLPGEGAILGGRAGVSTPRGIPTSISSPGFGAGPTELQMPISSPQPAPVSPTTTPFYGTLELPQAENDGPPDGLTLDRAIDITLDRSLDLRGKFMEIPLSRADTLQASLRSNPVFYQDGQLLQYGGTSTKFSRMAPGGPSQFDTNVSYPFDISHKRQARTMVATRAERVLEALYQDAIRQRIDDVYGAFVIALAARQTVRYARESVDGLGKLRVLNEQRYEKGVISIGELSAIRNKVRKAQLGLVDAEAAYRKAKMDLGSFMNLRPDEIASLELRGTIQDLAPPPPPLESLQKLATDERPDVMALRLGVVRAEADVRLARANAFSDVYVLWQPYTFQDNSPYGLKSQYSWALGVTVPLPIYNRNQGGILRARLNVSQSQIQLADMERQAKIDVAEAMIEYEVTRQEVQDLREQIIPDAKLVLDEWYKLWQKGERGQLDYIDALLDWNQTVKQYLDTAVRHRRSMLSLNTVVGRRIMP